MFVSNLPDEVMERFTRARSICVLTGAGISVGSGIATFRGPGRANYFANLPPDYFAFAQAWQENRELVSAFYNQFRYLLHKAKPSIAHQTIYGWQLYRFAARGKFHLLTQNFDGLHQLMGSETIELHGNIWQLSCENCNRLLELPPFRIIKVPDICPYCEGILRPNILFIDEQISEWTHRRALAAVDESEIFITIGISGVTHYAQFLAQVASQRKKFLIEINPSPTYISHLFNISLLLPADQILPQFYWD